MLSLDQSLVVGILRNWLESRFQNTTVFVNMFFFGTVRTLMVSSLIAPPKSKIGTSPGNLRVLP